ncbi:MAG: hypothetical protein E6J42_11075 [Chloroflexi bacterium]|nr:MAG: hypothetical protein E6J42_11075 [Chloroflexota bacterium]
MVTLLLLLGGCSGGNDHPFPTLTPFPSEIAGRLHQIRDRVSQIRELPVSPDIKEGMVSPESLKQEAAQEAQPETEEEKANLQAFDVVLKMLGLAPPEFSLQQAASEEYAGLIAGLYLPPSDSLVLVGGDSSQFDIHDELVLAHEYTAILSVRATHSTRQR